MKFDLHAVELLKGDEILIFLKRTHQLLEFEWTGGEEAEPKAIGVGNVTEKCPNCAALEQQVALLKEALRPFADAKIHLDYAMENAAEALSKIEQEKPE